MSADFTTLEELRKDKQRLDWLSKSAANNGHALDILSGDDVWGCGGTLREAIDAAMKQSAE